VFDTSRQTAAAAVRILGGESPGAIRLTPIEFATPKFDWREMQRWGISEDRLPAGSIIDYRDPTAWEQYHWQIMAIAMAVLLQSALIAVLFQERHRRRAAEIQTRQRMVELAHMNRCATAGELSAALAHEINQPLAAILCNAEAAQLMLKSGTADLHEFEHIVADIKKDDERAGEVLRRLRSFVKKTAFEPQEIDLNETVSEVFRFISAVAQSRGAALSLVSAPQPLQVRGDQVQLQQVILNLIMNGIEAAAAKPAEKPHITGQIEQKDDTSAEVSISDTGPGIPPDQLKKVFEPFFTTKNQGLGMGLSIARTIVEAHEGRIWVENRIGGGAVFHLSLPLSVGGIVRT
jgi:C4-dicarboxylate-specific signal transduction histidine kinase